MRMRVATEQLEKKDKVGKRKGERRNEKYRKKETVRGAPQTRRVR